MKQDKNFSNNNVKSTYARKQKAWAKWQKNVNERWTDNLTSDRLAYLTLG